MTDKEFSLSETLFSGQCFRVQQEGEICSVVCGVEEDVKTISLTQKEAEEIEKGTFWYNFFDLGTDYESIKEEFAKISPIMKKACDYAPGIRILNQNPWEALCSFVVSQNNNINRIMTIIDRMCSFYGTEVKGLHGFPSAEKLAGAADEDLRKTGLGFRAPYIINVATSVAEGKIDFNYLNVAPIDEARKILMNIKGIGPKVADCALLFGCHRLDCFPLDTWMNKVMNTYFEGCSSNMFGKYAGVAQQYLFHWARTSGDLK